MAKNGADNAEGSAEHPFLTIQHAAELARAGDTVLVHAGIYREWVRPVNGGTGDDCRITYAGAPGEKPVIKGSEPITGWQKGADNVWCVHIPNTLFAPYGNPFAKKRMGDWLVDLQSYEVHLGTGYLNGAALYEARCAEELAQPVLREKSELATWGNRTEVTLKPEESLHTWRAEVNTAETVLYANFGEADPNTALTEINVRPCCFYPAQTGVNYITVRGFEMA